MKNKSMDDDDAMGLATQFPTLEFKFASFLKRHFLISKMKKTTWYTITPHKIGFGNGWKVSHNLVG
jgi:hypothetical protein